MSIGTWMLLNVNRSYLLIKTDPAGLLNGNTLNNKIISLCKEINRLFLSNTIGHLLSLHSIFVQVGKITPCITEYIHIK